MIPLYWCSETKCEEWFGRVRIGRLLFSLLTVLCFSKWWITKMVCVKNGEVVQTAKWLQSFPQESFQVSHLKRLHFYTEFTAHKIFRIWKGAGSVRIWAETQGREENRRALASGLRRWICFIQQRKPWLYTKRDRMCPDMLCVCVPLFITTNASSAHCQYSASSSMQLNSETATGALSPGTAASDLLSSCILSHLGAHRWPHCCPVTSRLAIFVILCTAVPVQWYLRSIHQRTL